MLKQGPSHTEDPVYSKRTHYDRHTLLSVKHTDRHRPYPQEEATFFLFGGNSESTGEGMISMQQSIKAFPSTGRCFGGEEGARYGCGGGWQW